MPSPPLLPAEYKYAVGASKVKLLLPLNVRVLYGEVGGAAEACPVTATAARVMPPITLAKARKRRMCTPR
jgi:hypothetical protein